MSKPILTIGEAAEILGVTTETLRAWERDGKLNSTHTEGGHRRYNRIDIEKLAGIYIEPPKDESTNKVALYCRVSSNEQKQKGDLERQIGRLTTEALKRGYTIVAVFDEVGSGMNDNRKKLQKLFELVERKEINVVLVEHKDRLSRFCINYLIAFFNSYGVRVEWSDEILNNRSYEDELVEDILSLMASFSAKIYGKRSAKNRKEKQGK